MSEAENTGSSAGGASKPKGGHCKQQFVFWGGGNAMKLKALCSLMNLMVLILIIGNVHAQDIEQTRNALRGLGGVYVMPENPLEEDAIRGGLSQDNIRSEVEGKLRQAGIRVLSREEWEQAPGKPYLQVWPKVLKGGVLGGYIYHITVEFKQHVSLVRSPSIQVFGATWSVEHMGYTPDLKDIRDRMNDRIDKFIDAYLSVNPKK